MKQTLEAEGSALVDWFAANQMEANPEKCQGIAVGKKAHALKPTFNIQGADIECTDEVRLLGVTIDYRTNFDKHISNLCKKAARTSNQYIAPYWKISANQLPKSHLPGFYSICFNLCPIIWHFCSEANNNKH